MKKNSICILVISTNASTHSLLQTCRQSAMHNDVSLNICDNDEESIANILSKENVDLVVCETDDLDQNSCLNASMILENKISILFLILKKDLEKLIESDFDFHLVDYLVKPVADDFLKHKIEIYLQNILQKKACEYLLHAYDESVIASKTDKKGLITYVSQAFCDISEYSKEELIGKAHNIVRHADTPSETYRVMWETIQSAKQWQGEIKNSKKNGGFYWVKVTVSPEFNYNGEIIAYSSIRQDISSQKYIEQVSLIDYLTQVYNKKYYDEILDKEVYSAQRYGYNLSLLLLDIDLFKDINDTFGHQVGDNVLKEFASLLLKDTRKSDIVSRIGGEEFTIIVENDTIESANAFASKIRREIQEHEFKTVKNLTVSIGISSYIEGDTSQTLFKRVDDAMYQAKKNGRNQVVKL